MIKNEYSTIGTWYRRHRSALFIALLAIAVPILLWIGMNIKGTPNKDIIGTFLVQLSGTAFAGCIGMLFLSFPDIREQISSSIANLFSEGDIASYVSPQSLNTINRKIIAEKVGNTISFLDKSLYSHFDKVQTDCYRMTHLHNSNIQIRNLASDEYKDLIVYERFHTFRISAQHLRGNEAEFEYKLLHIARIPNYLDIKEEQFIKNFSARFDEQSITSFDLTRTEENSISVFKLSFVHNMVVNGAVDVAMRYSVLGDPQDRSAFLMARYPTYGFRATVMYTDSYDYEALWFTTGNPLFKEYPGVSETQRFDDGISVGTNEWVLPGEGLAVTWLPKKK